MLNTRATLPTSSTQPLQSATTFSEAVPSRTAATLPSGPADSPQARQSSHASTAPRAQLPTTSRASAPAPPSASTDNLWLRLDDMKKDLAALRTH